MKDIAKKIKKARIEAKLSQLQVGVTLGISDKTISGYESGRICPPVDKLFELADIFKKPVGYFIDTDDKEYRLSTRLRAVEIMLRDIRQEMREIKSLAQKYELD
jgi:transcriptional regulator with XRE-family HTH domain